MSLSESTLRREQILIYFDQHPESQNPELGLCRIDPVHWINHWAWTYDPREECTTRPFDLFARQEEFILWLTERDHNQESGLAEKSRDVGFTWLCAAYALHCWLFRGGDSTGFGSRKLDLVDHKDNPDCIFEKIRFLLHHLPAWMRPVGFEPHHHDKYCTLLNPVNGSTITGEGGSEIGRGGRKSRYFVDEAAYLPNPKTTDAALSQTTRVRIDVSTPNGMGNPFHTRRFNGSVPVFTFHWKDDPRKDDAWYEREKLRIADPVIIAQELDIDYTASIEGVCIPAAWVRSAINLDLRISGLPVAGWDIADEGRSVNVLVVRHGPVVTDVHQWARMDIIQSAHHAASICRDQEINTLSYDCIGVGAAVRGVFNAATAFSSPLVGEVGEGDALGRYGRAIGSITFRPNAVNVGEQPTDAIWPDGKTSRERFRNLRAELWWQLRSRFEKTHAYVMSEYPIPNTEHPESLISIPDHPDLIAQLSLPLYFYTETGKVQIESKKDMQKRGIASPDFADALVLAFASSSSRGGWAEAAAATEGTHSQFAHIQW